MLPCSLLHPELNLTPSGHPSLNAAKVRTELFHLMISHGLPHIPKDGKAMPDMEKLALALRAQRQCNDTVKDVAVIDYMRKMNFCEKNPSPPIPLKIQTNELKDGEND